MKVVALVFAAAPIAVRAAGGNTECPCLDGNDKATQATGKPSYPTEVAAYGFGCDTHDLGYHDCNETAGADVAAGQPFDWCASKWCKVDPDKCEFRSLHISYTGQPNDFFSYEACDLNFGGPQQSFAGNGWVGRCKNCAHVVTTGSDRKGAQWYESFCSCGGLAGCPCIEKVMKATQVTDLPTYPTETPSYGYGCKAHDSGDHRKPGAQTTDTCSLSNETAQGEGDDWCLDKWCIVDKNKCNLTNILSGYTGDTTDYFAYATCDANFNGNGWVGRCRDGNGEVDGCATSAPTPATTTSLETSSASKAVPALIGGAIFAAVAAF